MQRSMRWSRSSPARRRREPDRRLVLAALPLLGDRILDLGGGHGELDAIRLLLEDVGADHNGRRPEAEQLAHFGAYRLLSARQAHLDDLAKLLPAGAGHGASNHGFPLLHLRPRRLTLLGLVLLGRQGGRREDRDECPCSQKRPDHGLLLLLTLRIAAQRLPFLDVPGGPRGITCSGAWNEPDAALGAVAERENVCWRCVCLRAIGLTRPAAPIRPRCYAASRRSAGSRRALTRSR